MPPSRVIGISDSTSAIAPSDAKTGIAAVVDAPEAIGGKRACLVGEPRDSGMTLVVLNNAKWMEQNDTIDLDV